MDDFKFTVYFEKEVLRKRPYLKKECRIRVIEKPLKMEPQEHNRFRFWGTIDELEGRVLRVVTLQDKRTIHNAFPETFRNIQGQTFRVTLYYYTIYSAILLYSIHMIIRSYVVINVLLVSGAGSCCRTVLFS